MILALIDTAVAEGARLKPAAQILGLSSRTLIRWRRQNGGCDQRKGPRSVPANKLNQKEKQQILEVANSEKYREMSPKQIVPSLADQGDYIGSESSFYRVLKEHQMLTHRQRSKPATHHRPNAYVASGPCQVWSWDITYLHSSVRGMFYYLYMILDVWSRKIVAATVYETESMELSAGLFTQACFIHGVDPDGLVLHADNGGPMKGSTMQATLKRLGVIPSFSRPMVSDDNPYSESLFRTMKYRPEYPSGAFESLEHAQGWVDEFVRWYNTCHLHSAIRFVTPDDRHYGREDQILANRQQVYQKARCLHPNRWSGNTRDWNPVRLVWLNPADKDKAEGSRSEKDAA
jgi:transposase InsO family protein